MNRDVMLITVRPVTFLLLAFVNFNLFYLHRVR